MRRTVRKVFWIWDFDREEKWLNEMAAKGLSLVSVGFCRYDFEECLPGEYGVCMQMLEHLPGHAESEKYISFLEETGAEHVGTWQRWVYFRKRADGGSFELFSDNASRVKYLTRIINFIALLAAFNLFVGAQNLFMAFSLQSSANLLGLFNVALGVFALIGAGRLIKKRRGMRQDGQLFE